MLQPKDTVLIFDYDGTLNNSGLIYVPAFLRSYEQMVADGIAEPRDWQPEEITRYLGYSAVEMWHDFMPGLDSKLMEHYGAGIGEEMLRLIRIGQSKWYDGVEETLQTLHDRGYRMVVLSNCRREYLQAHREAFRMDRFFSGYYDCESFDFAPKEMIFETIRKEHPARDYVVIGDRRHDLAVAVAHKLLSIGCTYGYGKPEELDSAVYKVNKFGEILYILP